MLKKILSLSALASTTFIVQAQQIHIPLDGNVEEVITGISTTVNGVRTLPYQTGVSGNALRTDGYSNSAALPLTYTTLNKQTLSMSMWIAPEAYPMMLNDIAESTPTYALLAGNLDESAKSGFGIMLSSRGNVQFVCYNGTSQYKAATDVAIPVGQWTHILATYDRNSADRTKGIYIYINGEKVAEGARARQDDLTIGTSAFRLAKASTASTLGKININGYSGLMDDIKVWNTCLSADEAKAQFNSYAPVPTADMSISTEVWSDNILRPQFHGMPAHNWTNEPHGLIYSNGKYHVFFQKNGDGPWMSRLNWGHISSADLLNWKEERAAIVPGEAYDVKGCWSGAVFTDPAFNNGKPVAIYTAVDNALARIAMAYADDEDLLSWTKKGVIIDGKPAAAGLKDDFRDPFFFTANGEKYIIVGSKSSAGTGTCVLYKYNGTEWQYQDHFFTGTSAATCGTFWEMPTVTDLGNGKYLFTVNPLETAYGVKNIYWIGTIGSDGKFTPDQTAPQDFEATGTSKSGYGLLSPSIYNHDGKIIALGIVPDMVSGEENYNWGWAHNYSLPRELSLSADGKQIVQKPLTGLQQYRKAETTAGRQIEMLGTFQYSSAQQQGFRFFKKGDRYAELSIGNGKLTLDLNKLDRKIFDKAYNGKYETELGVSEGEQVTINAILDGSIIDIFVSSASIEGKAFSVRLYPTDAEATTAEDFGELNHTAKIWTLDVADPTAIEQVFVEPSTLESDKSYSARFVVEDGWVRLYNGKKRVF